MIRVLVLIAVAGFFVSVISFAGAAALGGADLRRSGWSFPITWDWEAGDGGRQIDWSGPMTTRTVAWEGADELNFVLPADVTFTQAATPSVVITGPKEAVDAVVVNGGHFTLRGRMNGRVSVKGLDVKVEGLDTSRRLKIAVTAPDVGAITASAATNLIVNGIEREAFELRAHAGSDVLAHVNVNLLKVEAHSGSDATVDGRADRLQLEVHSGADARLDHLAVNHAVVEAHSAGEAVLAPKLSADVEVHSGADVKLLNRPAQLHTDINSGGDLDISDATSPPTAPAVPGSPAEPAAPPAPPVKSKTSST